MMLFKLLIVSAILALAAADPIEVLAEHTLTGSGFQTVPAVKFQSRTFTICVKFKLNNFNKLQSLVGDWTKYWQFLFRIQSNNQLGLTLRRNIDSEGSDPEQDLVSVTGGNVASTHDWQTACAAWDNQGGTAYLFLNNALVADKSTTYSSHTLQENNHATYQVGWKGDGRNELIDGQIGFVGFYGDIVVGISGGGALSVLAKHSFNPYTRGQTIPAVRFQSISASICVRFKLNNFNKMQTLVGDWTKYWQFLFRIHSNNQLGLTLRRNIDSQGSDPNQDMVGLTGGNVATTHNWQTACADWNNESGTAYLYLNGNKVAEKKTTYPNHTIQVNDHTTYQIGWKGDSNSEHIDGAISNIVVYRGIASDLYLN